MADQLFLSYWLRNYSDSTMLRNYEKLLRLFPFSLLAQQATTFKIMAVDPSEPVVAEIPYSPPVPIDAVLAVAKDFQNADASYRLETWWDLWQFDVDWKLAPARVALCCFGPEFNQSPSGLERAPDAQPASVIAFPNPNEDAAIGCALEIEFGIDANFLPQPDLPDSPRMIESNIKSLLKLVHDLDDALPVETRRLWSESGENFAEKLHQALTAVAK
ncbi:MAG: hypothetical protein ABSE57_10780 [Bryobacteraceae bacterium]|jgi:hypothetical protein